MGKKQKPKKHYAEVLEVKANSASVVQRRVAKLNPARWPGVQAASAVSPASAAPEPAPEDAAPSLPAPSLQLSPLGCFEPAPSESEDAEDADEVNAVRKAAKASRLPSLSTREKVAVAARQLSAQAEAGKRASFLSSLQCYLHVCVGCGLVNRAFNTLLYYRNLNRNYQRKTDVRDVRLYNTVLSGLARKGQLDRVLELRRAMKEDAVAGDADSFALMLQCVGRQPRTAENARLACTLLREMDEEGVRLRDASGAALGAQGRMMALKALAWADADRSAAWPAPSVLYDCPLVEHLNADLTSHQVDSPARGVQLPRPYRELARQQLASELAGTVTVESVYKSPVEETPTDLQEANACMAELEAEWERTLTAGFQRSLAPVRAQFHSNRMSRCISLYPYLTGMDTREYVQVMMREIQNQLSGSGQSSLGKGFLHRQLGHAVMLRYHSQSRQLSGLVERTMEVYQQYLEEYRGGSESGYLPRHRWQRLLGRRRDAAELEQRDRAWSPLVISSVGKFLYKLILHDVKIDPAITRLANLTEHPIPAFYTVYRQEGARQFEVVKPHPSLQRLYRTTRRHRITFDANQVPMVAPPLPWVSAWSGGYLLSSQQLMRIRTLAQASSQMTRLEHTPSQQLYPVLDSLNQLAAVPWVINTRVLDLMVQMFNSGGCDELDIPSPVSRMPPLPTMEAGLSPADKYKVKRQRAQMSRRKAEQYSLWCDALYKLSLANHFRDGVIWLPHNIDFRGRAYPCPPHLSHLGSDVSRSLLQFARGEPLGERGLEWLKVHLINLTGLKKRESTAERLRFCDQVLPDVLDSADYPFAGGGWWRQSEEPWQTLSACMELAAALRSPDPAAYVSRLPVHQDGSCNGLQHYAALGRDCAGAVSVNLAPADVPQDVYSGVAALVEQQRQRDAADGLPIAVALEGFVRRKVIKQTVMTTVYGVTRFGGRLQIAKQLHNIPEFPQEHVWQGSHYLVTRTFLSIQQMFTAAKEIQAWFTECARAVTAVRGEPVEWVTPLGLPVLQPYFRNGGNKSKTLGETGVTASPHFYHENYDRPNGLKQRNAFPPNFIHSLDSSHMMLTSLNCQHAGLNFVSVHDCYWTHAASVDRMNRICREQFVALHSWPVLERLSEDLLQRFGYEDLSGVSSRDSVSKTSLNSVLAALPQQGNFDLSRVLDSVYFFS